MIIKSKTPLNRLTKAFVSFIISHVQRLGCLAGFIRNEILFFHIVIAIIAFWTWSRFSASSQTLLCGPSITSFVIS